MLRRVVSRDLAATQTLAIYIAYDLILEGKVKIKPNGSKENFSMESFSTDRIDPMEDTFANEVLALKKQYSQGSSFISYKDIPRTYPNNTSNCVVKN